MRPSRAQHLRLDALGALGRRASQTVTGTAAPRWTRSMASDRDSNLFRRAPTPLAGEKLPEAQSELPPSKPWPKPQPVATAPSPPAKPRQIVEKVIKPDPPSTFRRAPTPLPGEVLINAQPVSPPPKLRAAAKPASSATTACQPDRELPTLDPRVFRDAVPTPMEGEALIKPRDESRKRPSPPPEPPKATPLSREEAKEMSLRKPELFDGEDAPVKISLSSLADLDNQVGDDQSENDAQQAGPTLPDRQTLQEGKINPLECIEIGNLLTFGIPPVAIRDSLRCIASYSEGPISGNPPVRDLYVPGAPAIFQRREFPHFLTPGPEATIGWASFRYESPFMAMRAMSDICLDDVDVVITSSYLRQLFATCSDQRFGVDRYVSPKLFTLIRNTLIVHGMVEDDAETQQLRATTKLPSHLQRGHMFQNNFTRVSEDIFHNSNFCRVLQYKLGDLNCIVIVETDAVIKFAQNDDGDGPHPPDRTALSEEISLDIQPVPRGPDTGKGWRPRLIPAGKFAERRTWTELKIGTPDFSDLLSQVYFCDNLFAIYGILGRNCLADKGRPNRWTRINGIILEDFLRNDRLSIWEQKEQLALRRTVAVLHQMRRIAKRQGDGQTCVFWRLTKNDMKGSADQPGEGADQPAEGADQPAEDAAESTESPKQRVRDLKACDMVITVKTWHTPAQPIPPELIDHFWTTPGSGTKPVKRPLIRYYKSPVCPWEASEIDDQLALEERSSKHAYAPRLPSAA